MIIVTVIDSKTKMRNMVMKKVEELIVVDMPEVEEDARVEEAKQPQEADTMTESKAQKKWDTIDCLNTSEKSALF